MWADLIVTGLDKRALIARRREEMEAKRTAEAERAAAAKTRAAEDGRLAVRQQMAIDDAERRRVEDLREEEKQAAEEEVYRKLGEVERAREAAAEAERKAAAEAERARKAAEAERARKAAEAERARKAAEEADGVAGPDGAGVTPVEGAAVAAEATPAESVDAAPHDQEDAEAEADAGAEPVFVPPPRATQATTVSFTPRVFPTPMRESKKAEEDDWVAKNRRFLKSDPAARNVTERDPIWLKGKGDDFFKAGDFRSAINAYTAAYEADSLLAPALSNRAACHLRLSEPQPCVADCTELLRLLPRVLETEGHTPAAKDKAVRLEARALARRGAAHMLLHQYDAAVADLSSALRLAPSDTLRTDLARAESMAGCARRKARADAAFREGRFEDASAAYSEVLAEQPRFLGCIANRAACALHLERWDGTVRDCTVALALLRQTEPGVQTPDTSLPAGPFPAPNTTQRTVFKLKALTRRATALERMGKRSTAVGDLRLAHQLDPLNEDLAARLEALEREASQGGE